MKQLKKLLCLVIAISVVMTSIPAFAKTYLTPYEFMDDVFEFDVGEFADGAGSKTETAITPDTERIKLLNSLGVWDNPEIDPDSFVSMTEFAIIMSKVRLGAENPFEGAYLKDPDDQKVTYAICYEYLLDALGYYHECAAYGNTEEALVIVASKIGLISSAPEKLSAYITRAELSKLISKALTIDLSVMEMLENGGYRYVVESGKTLLSEVHDIYYVEGFVNAIPGLSVFGGGNLKTGYFEVDRTKYAAGNLDVKEYLGAFVNLYTKHNEETNEREIIFIDYENKDSVYEINYRDIVDIDDNEIIYNDADGNEVSINYDLTYITQNGMPLSSVSELSDYTDTEGVIRVSASEGKDELDTIVAYTYNYFTLEYVDARSYKLGLKYQQKYNDSNVISLDEKAEINVYIDGVKSEFKNITAGSAIKFMMCPGTGYAEINVSTKKINGEVEAFSEDLVEISGKSYILSKDLVKHIAYCKGEGSSLPDSQKIKDIDVGLSTTFFVVDNMLVSYTSSSVYLYGYFVGASRGRSSLDSTLTLKIFDQDANMRQLKTPEKFELDGKKNSTPEEFSSLIAAKPQIVKSVIRFKANGKDEITAIDTINESEYELDSSEDVTDMEIISLKVNWTYEWMSGTDYWLKPASVFFVIPAGEEDESEWRVVNNTALPSVADDSENLPAKLYSVDELKQINVGVVTRNLTEIGTESSSGGYVYVESISKVMVDPENFEYGYKIKGKTAKASAELYKSVLGDITFTVDEDVFDKNLVPESDPAYDINKRIEVGDLINATVSAGKANIWNMILKDGNLPEITGAYETDYTSSSTTGGKFVGKIKVIDYVNEMAVVQVGEKEKTMRFRSKMLIDSSSDKVEQGTMADFYVGDTVWGDVNYGRVSLVVKKID